MKNSQKVILLVILITIISTIIILILDSKKQEFDVNKFIARGYSQEEIELFIDIAFVEGEIEKWDTDIYVQIKGEKGRAGADIDPVIKLLSPLVSPLKMEIVKEHGNVIIYRGVKSCLVPRAIAFSNTTIISPRISKAWIFESNNVSSIALTHELEHILGLSHPRKGHPYALNIKGNESPSSIPAYYYTDTYYLSNQEKKVIKMLYSSEIKNGLKRSSFMKDMGIQDHLKTWNLPTNFLIYRLILGFALLIIIISIMFSIKRNFK